MSAVLWPSLPLPSFACSNCMRLVVFKIESFFFLSLSIFCVYLFSFPKCSLCVHQPRCPKRENWKKSRLCSNPMSFCFSIHKFFCFFFPVHILKKTDNSVLTIDDFCVGIDLLDSELNAVSRLSWIWLGQTNDWTCLVVAIVWGFDFKLLGSKEKDRMIDIFGWWKMSCCAAIDFEKIENETKIRGTWCRGARFDGDQHYSCVRNIFSVWPALCDAFCRSELF